MKAIYGSLAPILFESAITPVAILILSLFFLLLISPARARAQDNETCFGCHNKDILELSPEERAEMVSPAPEGTEPGLKYKKERFRDLNLAIDQLRYGKSVHGSLDCISCHFDIKDIPHLRTQAAVECGNCHSEIQETYEQDYHYQKLKAGISDAPLCQDCHGTHYIRPVSDKASLVNPNNLSYTCGRCHEDEEMVKKYGLVKRRFIRSYQRSVHYQFVREELGGATCNNCHGTHDMRPARDPKSRVYRSNVPQTCASCHKGVYEQYKDSTHGKAVNAGNLDSPVCTTCHNEHDIEAPTESTSAVYTTEISKTTCPQCHSATRIVRKYGLPSDTVTSYKDSYHGLADQLGSTTTANCASCHGVHAIYPSTDPRSTIYPENLKKTCGEFHPGATDNFARGRIHPAAVLDIKGARKSPENTAIFLVQVIYVIIFLNLGFMIFHNALDYFSKVRKIYRERKNARKIFVRWNTNEIIQHAILMVTFTVLVISGFALKFKLSIPGISGDTMEPIRAWSHRVAALFFIALGIYHIGYLFLTPRGQEIRRDLLLGFKDLKDLFTNFGYYLGFTPKNAQFDRFSYVEKMEYFAMIWGTLVMVVTGFMLWFPTQVMYFLPRWSITVAELIHLLEAVLATCAIVIWHFYSVHLNPDVAPMSMVWISGTLTEEEMAHEHPLELKRLKAKESD